MPVAVGQVKKFVALAKRKDATALRIKKNKDNTKFKLRTSRYLYTLSTKNPQRIKNLRR